MHTVIVATHTHTHTLGQKGNREPLLRAAAAVDVVGGTLTMRVRVFVEHIIRRLRASFAARKLQQRYAHDTVFVCGFIIK